MDGNGHVDTQALGEVRQVKADEGAASGQPARGSAEGARLASSSASKLLVLLFILSLPFLLFLVFLALPLLPRAGNPVLPLHMLLPRFPRSLPLLP